MTSVFNLEGQKADPNKIGYINKVFPINKQSKYNDTIQLNIGDTTIPAKLPAKGQGWKLGKLITFQIPNNIYIHQDNDIYFFVDFTSETELKVNSMPNENQLKELEEFKIPTIEELNIKDLIINYNKNRCDRDGGCTEEDRKKNNDAATKIQAVQRGRMARRRRFRGPDFEDSLNFAGGLLGVSRPRMPSIGPDFSSPSERRARRRQRRRADNIAFAGSLARTFFPMG